MQMVGFEYKVVNYKNSLICYLYDIASLTV